MQNNPSSKKILVTFARSFLALEISRHFHAAGHEVYVVDSIDQYISKYSNTIHKSFQIPSPRFEPVKYIQSLVRIVEQEKIDLIIPVYEEISYLSKAAEHFSKTCKILCPKFDLYQELHNKYLFQKKLNYFGFETLKFELLENNDDLKKLNFNVPFALKPCYTRASQKIQKIYPHQVNSVNINFSPYNPWLAQEWAAGKKYCSYSICNDGKIFAHVVYPVEYAIEGNSCITFRAIQHAEIYNWIQSFIEKINFTGQIAFDFIETEEKKIFAIECNPRATSGVLLFNENAHFDEPFLGVNQTLLTPREGIKRQIAMGMIIYGWRRHAKANNLFRDFIKDFLSTKDVVFKLKDLKPFLLEPLVFAYIWYRSFKLGMNIPNFFTYDHDWNGEPLDNLAEEFKPKNR